MSISEDDKRQESWDKMEESVRRERDIGEPDDPSCYVCGHAPEEHRNEDSGCEFEDGCACICFESRQGTGLQP